MSDSPKRVLVVDDEPGMREWLAIFLKKEGFRVSTAGDRETALRALDKETYDLTVCDVRLPDGNGLDVLRHARRVAPDMPILMMTAYSSTENAVEAMRLGAADYLIKPVDLDEFRLRLDAAFERRELKEENVYLRKSLGLHHSLGAVIAVSESMQRLLDMARRVAPTDSTILIHGESGVGKELVARAVHEISPRAPYRFVGLNCAALPETLMESELFGHRKGSFTGAVENKRGLFEAAHRGTIFLDEISEMPPAMQAKLLRALQERKIRALGSDEETEVDIRVISATNRDLESLVREGRFREDLYYRLNVIVLDIPPLRERPEDIRPLALHFLREFAERMGKNIRDISGEAMTLLERARWPGNVRELKNVIERAVVLETLGLLTPQSLPDSLRGIGGGLPSEDEIAFPEGFHLEDCLDETARRYLRAALKRAGGVKTKAAALLGMNERSFRYYVKKLRIDS